MSAIYRQSGEYIEYTPASDLAVGTLVAVGSIVGINKAPIAAGTRGVIATRGVFEGVAKYNVGNSITAGNIVFMNPANGKIYNTQAAGYIACGYALKDAEATADSVDILLCPLSWPISGPTFVPQVAHKPAADVAAGSLVVVGSMVGVAEEAIAANADGKLTLSGCFTVAKHGTSNALTDGQLVYVNPSNGKIYNASATGYILCGYAVGAATATSTSCTIYLTPSCTAAAS